MLDSPLLPRPLGYVDGVWSPAESGDTMPVLNPATGDNIAMVPAMGKTETVHAIDAAARTLASPSTIEQRRTWLDQLADGIIANREEFGRIITHEHGKPWREAQGEAEYAASFFRYYARNLDHLQPRTVLGAPRNHRSTVHHRSAGVAAMVTPWNFPLAMLAKKFSAALAADCGCVIKPSSKTPLSLIALFSLIEQLDLPPGKANLIMGPASPISDALCEHPAVRVISFTGSTHIGKKLMAAAAPHLKRLSLELGGNAPFLVFEDADMEQAVEHVTANKFRGAGQTCVCANRLYVHSHIANEFADRLAARASKLEMGDGMSPGVDMGPLIDRKAFDKVKQHVDDALTLGAIRIAGNEPAIPAEGQGCFFPPTVLRGVTAEMQCVKNETFGPLAPIIEFQEESEVVSAANDTEYGLAAYVFTSDEQRAARVISQLSFGHVGHNTGSGPTAEAPFGGMKQSGFGRGGGVEGLHDYIESQTVASPSLAVRGEKGSGVLCRKP